MNSKITLNVDKILVEKAKKYALEQGVSLSSLVASFFSSLPENRLPAPDKTPQPKKVNFDELKPLPQSFARLQGILKGMSEEDVENARWEYLKKKHNL